MRDRIHRLRTVPLFSQLDEAQLEDLAFLAAPFALPAGHRLFTQGECSDGMYLIESGEVAISVRIPGDEAIEVARAGPGALVGEMGLLDRCPRSARAEAETAVNGFFFSHHRFEMLRADLRPAAFRILHSLLLEVCRRIRASHQEILNAPRKQGHEPARRWRQGEFTPVKRELAGWPADVCRAGTEVPVIAQTSLPFFQGLASTDITRLLDQAKLVALPRNSVLQQADVAGQDAYLIVRGAVAETMTRAATEETLRVHGPGSWVGIASSISDCPTLTALTVREHAMLLAVEAAAVREWMSGGSVAASRFVEHAASALVNSLRSTTAYLSRLAMQEANMERKRTQTGMMAAIEI